MILFIEIIYFSLKARQIREEILGKDTPDTATVYNNLGCNMIMLNRLTFQSQLIISIKKLIDLNFIYYKNKGL